MDPVDPVTGEFIIQEVDLAFPGFGVPFRLARTYRSRVDFDGPLGPAWDHTYNQRLVEAPRLDLSSSEPIPTVYALLGHATSQTAVFGLTSCGPSLALSTGEGTTILFNETFGIGGVHKYWSSAALLTLSGVDGPDGPTWTLRSPGGDVRRFDSRGFLVGWVDANGVGLSIEWSGEGAQAHVASVTDSAGRDIAFEYDGANGLDGAKRLVRVVEPGSQLEATYTYGANGALASARGGDGRQESYDYDVDLSRTRGDWVAEEQLRLACETGCAVSDYGTCATGGACDVPVSEAMTECRNWVENECGPEYGKILVIPVFKSRIIQYVFTPEAYPVLNTMIEWLKVLEF